MLFAAFYHTAAQQLLMNRYVLLIRYSDGTATRSYAHCPNHPDRTVRQLLLVRAAVGLPDEWGVRTDRKLRQPREQSAGSGVLFDSVRGGPHRPSHAGPGERDSAMVVLYDLAQAYPEYVAAHTAPVTSPICV